MTDSSEKPAGGQSRRVSPLKAGLLCRCPNCGEGRLFAGYLTVAPVCAVCGFNLAAQDSGDGPAVFVVLIVGMIVVGLALMVESIFGPPMWVHMLLWIPLILVLALWLLRPFKATLLALQFHHRAGDQPPPP